MEAYPVYLLIFACVAVTSYMVFQVMRGLGSGKASSQFNCTSDWTPAPEHEPEKPPAGTPLISYEMRIVAAHLEAGETLQGCARGFFSPPRRLDYKIGTGVEKLPLLIAGAAAGRLSPPAGPALRHVASGGLAMMLVAATAIAILIGRRNFA
jgi:hypothetical protein